jgi:hypothetical protein
MSTIATLGPIRTTTPRVAGSNPISTFSALLGDVKGAGLLGRTRVFYISVFTTLVLALGGAITGFVLLGDSWFQLIIAGVLGIIFTQFAFMGHEASHRQVFESGRANDRIGRALSSGLVGISYSWWMNKHTRHHANPNTVGKDPDIEVDTVSFLEEDAANARGIRAFITKHQGAFWKTATLKLSIENRDFELLLFQLRSMFLAPVGRSTASSVAETLKRLRTQGLS